MAIINRISRLFAADLHGVLDRIEEPDLLLRQAVREMEEQLAQSEREQQEGERQLTILQRRHETIEEELAGIAEQLDLCFQAGKQDLARSFVRRRLQAERCRQQLRRQGRELERQLAERAGVQAANRERCESMKQKAELFISERPTAETGFEFREPEITDADVEVAWLRELERRQS